MSVVSGQLPGAWMLGAGEERRGEERRGEERRGAGLKAGCTGSVAANRRLRKDVSLRFIRVCPSPESPLYHTSGNGQAPFFVFRVSRHGHSGPLTECRTRRSRSRSRRIEKSKASHPPDRDRHANSRRRAAEYLFRPSSFRRAVEHDQVARLRSAAVHIAAGLLHPLGDGPLQPLA